jgi:DNA replication protein DnaC
VPATALPTAPARAHVEGRPDERPTHLAEPKLLVVDEAGHPPSGPDAAHLSFQPVSRRYERGSPLITGNRGVGEWGTVFGEPRVS